MMDFPLERFALRRPPMSGRPREGTLLPFLLPLLLVACGSSGPAAEAADAGHSHAESGGAGALGLDGGAGTGGAGGTKSTGSALTLTSSVFQEGATIPAEYRCGAPSPDLAWTGGPSDLGSFALVLRDVTPGISNGFFHWVLYDVPNTVTSLPKGVPVGYAPDPPASAHQAPIWNGTVGFNGPCGGNNTYELTLYAVDQATLPGTSEASTGAQVMSAIDAHTLEKVTMTVKSKP
jgi:Raf kinase inhibitor-like YbhB/YbcL family protein